MTEENDLMSEFRKLQSETTGIRSLFSDNSSIDVVGLTGNKLAKDIHDFCEKTTELNDRFNKEVMKKLEFVETELKDQREATMNKNDSSKKEILNQIQIMENKQKEEIATVQNQIEEIKESLKQSRNSMLDGFRNIRSSLEGFKNGEKREISVNSKSLSLEKNGDLDKTIFEKKFVLKETFGNISAWKKLEPRFSRKSDHFGFEWSFYARKISKKLFIYVEERHKYISNQHFTADTEVEVQLISKDNVMYRKSRQISKGSGTIHGFPDFIKWEEMMNNYVIDDKITFEVHFKINKITGFYKESSRSFDENMEDYSDTVLIVHDKKFHVFESLLSAQSNYFKSLLSNHIQGSFDEKPEYIISNVDSEDFDVFLGVLYGDALDETTVEVALLLSKQFDARKVSRRCELFLIHASEKTTKKKFELAMKYDLVELKNKCISDLQSAEDVREMLPDDISEMDPSILPLLLKKSLSF